MALSLPAPTRRLSCLTPLIDIVFLLLVFLMLTTDFGRMLSMPVIAPANSSEAASEATAPTLRLHADGTAEAAEERGGDGQLVGMIAALQPRPGKVVVEIAAGVPVQRVVSAIDALKANGITSVSLSRLEGGAAK